MADWGYGFSNGEVRDIVQEYLAEMKIENPFKEDRPGHFWLTCGFLKRHPDIVPSKSEHFSSARARAEDPEVIKHWFKLLEDVLTEAGVKDHPAQIFNTDESGYVTDPKAGIVLARKGSKRVNQEISGSGKEQITVNFCASASGKHLPPYVVYNAKNLYKDWMVGGPDGAAYNTSKNGWMESVVYLDWFRDIFLKHTQDVADKPRVLTFDGHASHLSIELIQKARANNVILLRLPSNLTHKLQPLNVAVFRGTKMAWQGMLKKYKRKHLGPVGKKDFPGLLKELMDDCSSDSVKSGFTATGICPLNGQAVDLDQSETTATQAAPSSSAPGPSTMPTLAAPSLPTASSARSSPAPETPSSSSSTRVPSGKSLKDFHCKAGSK